MCVIKLATVRFAQEQEENIYIYICFKIKTGASEMIPLYPVELQTPPVNQYINKNVILSL